MSPDYGIAVCNIDNTTVIRYCVMAENSGFPVNENMRFTGTILDEKDLPTAENAKKEGFVSIDYEAKIAIKKDGDVFRIAESGAFEGRQNWVNEDIFANAHATFMNAPLAPDKKYLDKEKPVPVVNMWSLVENPDGKMYLRFLEAAGSDELGKNVVNKMRSDIRLGVEVTSAGVDEYGNPQVSFVLDDKIQRAYKDEGKRFTVTLGIPVLEQRQEMMQMTKDYIGDAHKHLELYMKNMDTKCTPEYIVPANPQKNASAGAGEYFFVPDDGQRDGKIGHLYRADFTFSHGPDSPPRMVHLCGAQGEKTFTELSPQGLIQRGAYRVNLTGNVKDYVNAQSGELAVRREGKALVINGMRIDSANCEKMGYSKTIFNYSAATVRQDQNQPAAVDKQDEKDTKSALEM